MNYIERYWRDATPEDAIKDPPMVARFRDKDEGAWHFDTLSGWNCRKRAKWLSGVLSWQFCQVYDAPDPGEGWRLIDTEIEKGEVGDEFLTQSGVWLPECRHNGFEHGVPYRRRIEPSITYTPFTWEDREQLRGRIITFIDRNRTVEFRCESFSVDDDGFLVNDTYANWLCKNAVFVDTKESVGKKVAQ